MKQFKRINGIILIVILLMIGGCQKSEKVNSTKDITIEQPAVTASIEPTTEPVLNTTEPVLDAEALSMEAYEKFINNEMKLSFDYIMHMDNTEEASYMKEGEHSLSEVLGIITEHYFNNSTDKKIESIDYAYIDCGNDGVKELALRFNGMDIYSEEDESTLVYIIKYIDGKLSLRYYFNTWARSESIMNEYGYLWSGGSNGASNYMENYSLIDKAGNWQFIVSTESEQDINQLIWSDKLGRLPAVAEKKGISGGMELNTICFDYDNKEEGGNKEYFYTFYVYDENGELIEDNSLYKSSIYKEIFDEAEVPFITPDEVQDMISEKEKRVGAAAEIKAGEEIIWKTLDGSMLSNYVGS